MAGHRPPSTREGIRMMMTFSARRALAVAGSVLCGAATVSAGVTSAQASPSATSPSWQIKKILNAKYDSNLLN